MEKTTVTVNYVAPHFIITSLDGEAQIHESVFCNELYKYRSDFEITFLKCFPGTKKCKLSSSAEEKQTQILTFNRL